MLARQSYLESTRQYAWEYAGIDASDKDDDFLTEMTRYRSYLEKHHRKDSYEHAQILGGNRDLDYDIPPEKQMELIKEVSQAFMNELKKGSADIKRFK